MSRYQEMKHSLIGDLQDSKLWYDMPSAIDDIRDILDKFDKLEMNHMAQMHYQSSSARKNES